nr:DUF1365 domain-containing protein [Ralstonia mannitolilytica]
MSPASSARPLIALGEVRHRRLRPVQHGFAYPALFVLLPMRALRRDPALLCLPRRRFALLGFDDRDHGAGGDDALAWAEGLLGAAGIDDADGEIWLQTFPRVLGHVFKPVSFWYCHRADGSLRAVLAEVNNTFGDRHVYLLEPGAGRRELHWGEELVASKAMHVSPFCAVQGSYHFRFLRCDRGGAGQHIVARVDHHDAQGPLLLTSIGARLHELTPARARRALLAQPLAGFAVMLRIHWQALRLWRRRVPWFSRPAAPADSLSRGTSTPASPSR